MATKKPTSPILSELREASLDEAKAVEFMERHRWGAHPACPKCGSVDVYKMLAKDGGREKNYRWRCRDCKRMYSVRTGLVLEESRLPVRVWVYAFWRACASKKGVSALQISRECEVSYKSALFLMHRIRFAMTANDPPKLSGTVEADETYVGGKPRHSIPNGPEGTLAMRRARGTKKVPVFAVVQRGGEVRASTVPRVNKNNVRKHMLDLVDTDQARLITDESPLYTKMGRDFSGGHETVNHGRKEYVREGTDVHTNTIEGFFSLIKRGVYGTFHSVSKEHLHRYVAEFEFRYNTRGMDDGERIAKAIKQGEGKRLLYSS